MQQQRWLFQSIILFLNVIFLFSQGTPSQWYIGGFVGLNANFHRPDFAIPAPTALNVPEGTGRFDRGSVNLGYHGGIMGEYRFSPGVGLALRIGYAALDGNLTAMGQWTPSGDSSQFQLDATLRYGEILPSIRFYDIAKITALWGSAGILLGIPLAQQYEIQTLQIGDNSQTSYIPRIDLPNPSLQLALSTGIGYEFPLNNRWSIAPVIQLIIPLTQVSDAATFDSWRIPQLRLSASFKLALDSPSPPPPPQTPLAVDLTVGYYDRTGRYAPLDKIRLEEVAYSELYPIVPYIFFDKNRAEIPSVYRQFKAAGTHSNRSSTDTVAPDAIIQNYRILHLVGQRMQEFPHASLTIVGTTDGTEPLTIAQQRAEAVKLYLVSTFGISPARILVKAQRLPAKPSAIHDPDGQAENRRVELYPSIPEILEPVVVEKQRQRLAFPEYLEFRPSIHGLDSTVMAAYVLEVRQADTVLLRRQRRGFASIFRPIRWHILPDQLLPANLPLEYTYQVTDAHQRTDKVRGLIPVEFISRQQKTEQRLPDRKIQKFSLILFDFDKAELTPLNQRILDRYVIPAITFTSTVKIYGYTDRIGDADYNKRLAQRRAETVKQYLQSKAKARSFEAVGVGEDLLLYDNDIPIGRQLSRTVQIIVETPLSQR